ncbi:uncharacterized protein LOC143918065 [Arctopsyche grandis]|uniref:uncharacterized protein LOC143918065 n=1 Tax=Arctopsyche grandis TaxID=121162 RepID=UPI00406D7489
MKVFILLFATAICAVVQGVVIPEKLKICGRNELNKCLRSSISLSLKNMADGIPELNIPSLDPYELSDTVLDYKQDKFVAKFATKNIKAHGLSSSKIHSARINFVDDQMLLEIDVTNPRIFVEGSYRGDVGFEPTLYTTENAFNNTMTDLKWTWKIEGKVENIKGENYVRITKFDMSPKVGNMVFLQPNVFGDNPTLNMLAQDFISAYWRTIYTELLPIVKPVWNKIGASISNKIFLNIPLNEIFPNN